MGVKISNLPNITTPALSDIFPVVQAGITYKETFTQLSSLFATSGSNANITSLTGITGVIQAPTFINDANGNPILGFTPLVGSPVNYLTILNSSTGAGPSIQAVGSDTNVSLVLAGQGAGQVVLVSTSNAPVVIKSGTSLQHNTNLNCANTNASQNVTFPDASGTVYLSSKANGTEAANAVTASGTTGVITTSSLTTASGSAYSITWTNTFISTSSTILLSLMGGTNTSNTIQVSATAGNGTSTITITNNNGSSLNGNVLLGYMVIP